MQKTNVKTTGTTQIVVRPDLQPLLGEFTFEDFFNLQGRTEKDHPATDRHTTEVIIGGRQFFLKRHNGVGWREILKNVCSLKRPVIGAYNEYWALQHLPEMGISTAPFAAYGSKGRGFANTPSFVMTEALSETETLERFVPRFFRPPLSPRKVRLKRALIASMANIAQLLHENGFVHQDLYLCHFLIDLSAGESNLTPANLNLYLMDLHRIQRIALRKQRYSKKDLAALYFSAMNEAFTERDKLRFLKTYENTCSLRGVLPYRARWWKYVQQRAERLMRRTME